MTAYCSTKEVIEFLQLDLSVPDYDNQMTTRETVITVGASNTATVYTDKTKIIDGTYTFSYGASATATQTNLTETTHYTLDKDIGAYTLTSAGNTAVGSDGVFAVYKYNNQFKDSVISAIIDRKTKLIDGETHQSWQTTTLTENEEHIGRGAYDRIYRPENSPLLFAKTQLTSSLTSSATAMSVDTTTGFTVGDYITLNSEVILVDEITNTTTLGVTRGQYGTTAITHSDNDALCNVVVQASNAPVGFSPSFNVLDYNNEFEIDSNTGAIQVLHINPSSDAVINSDVYPEHHVFNRLRITYRSGATSIPDDIKNLCVLMTAKELFNAQVLNALSRGTDGFKTEALSNIVNEIKVILKENKKLLSSRG